MKIMVLGSTGALGTALEIACKNKGFEYAGVSHKDFEITNKSQLENLIEKNHPHAVINSVAFIGINPCEPQKTFDINSISASNLAKICERMNIIFVQPSSHAVFDGRKNDYYTEKDTPNPTNTYGISKLAAELFTVNISSKHYVVRFPTLFGPRRNSSLGFSDKAIAKLRNGDELKIADDKIDSPTYTLDIAHRLTEMLKEGLPYGIYHLTNSGKVSYYEFVSEIAKFMGVSNKIIRAKDSDFPTLAPKPLKTAMSSVKLNLMRGWKDALKDYIDTYFPRKNN
jgi:dTDP-4-dehydrorhamnose reductase